MKKNRTLEDYKEEVQRLQGLIDSFNLLNSSLNLKTVLLNTLKMATEYMRAATGSIALINEEGTHLEFKESTDSNFAQLKNIKVPLGKGIAGYVAQTGKPVRVRDVHTDKRFYNEIDQKIGHTTEAYLCVPLMVDYKVIGTAQLMNRVNGQEFTEDDVELMTGFAQQAALAIQNAKMHEMTIRQKAIESEMAVCAEIQQKLFPERLPEIPGFQIHGASRPSREVGGDYYTCIPRNDQGYYAVIADVSGKGVSAALMVSELHAAIHLLSRISRPLDKKIEILNDHLVDSLIPGKFITLFAALFHANEPVLEYVLAGHPPPMVFRPNGELYELERTGHIIGMQRAPFEKREITMEKGDLLVSFSDGYPEAMNAAGDLFDEERMAEIIRKHFDHDLVEIQDALDAEIKAFMDGEPAHDDISILMIRKT